MPHPFGVASSQVIVDGSQAAITAGQGIKVEG